MIFLFTAFYHVIAPIGPTYVMEVAPFSLRAKALMEQTVRRNIGLGGPLALRRTRAYCSRSGNTDCHGV